MDGQAPSSSFGIRSEGGFMQPGLPANPRMPVHPRHPRASSNRTAVSGVTRDLRSEHFDSSESYMPLRPAPSHLLARPGNIAGLQDEREQRAISRPPPDLQWPFAKPSVPYPQDSDAYFPQVGRSPAESWRMHSQRESQHIYAPSEPDHSDSQEPTFLFQDSTQSSRYSQDSEQPLEPESPLYQHYPTKARDSATSREKSSDIPNFTWQLRRTPWQGPPPPSSRRGESSLYSTPSLVPPIPEESIHSTSRGSYASSAVMPDSLYANSEGHEPDHDEAPYEQSVSDESGESILDNDGDEKGLVDGLPYRSDSSPANSGSSPRATIEPFHQRSFFIDASTDFAEPLSAQSFTPAGRVRASSDSMVASNTMHNASIPQSVSNPADVRKASASPSTGRLFAMRRPPKLDMDAVKAAEARGSLTSLPDLILRATKLAAMMDRGKRPTSRLDDLDDFDEKNKSDGENRSYMHDQYASGLSDMLAAFPPPVHTPQNGLNRASAFWGGSWPLIPGIRDREATSGEENDKIGSRPPRRCCGLPPWGFVLVILLMLSIVAVAVVLPIEYFVLKNLGQKNGAGLTVSGCRKTLSCLNGGTTVVSQGTCSCICTNGFTGAMCDIGGSEGCITTNLVATDGSTRISNVTLGRAIPRIIADSSSNFSIPLSATSILAKFNAANLSCTAQNALVTFDGEYMRMGAGNDPVPRDWSNLRRSPQSVNAAAPAATAAFVVRQETLDFARTAVLYVLQEESVDSAGAAQDDLQQFFSKANPGQTLDGRQVTVGDASRIAIGGNGTVDLVSATVTIGHGEVGRNQG